MLLKISFGKRSNRPPERSEAELSYSRCESLKGRPVNRGLARELHSRAMRDPSPSARLMIARHRLRIRDEAGALGAGYYRRKLRAKIVSGPDFQTKCERMAEETVFFATAIARSSPTPFANSAVIAAE
jgi:hypothetical protein